MTSAVKTMPAGKPTAKPIPKSSPENILDDAGELG